MIKCFPINSVQPNRAGLLRAAIAKAMPADLEAKFLFLWTGKYDGDDLLNDLDTDVITVTGKDWATVYIPSTTSATFSVPDNATYIAADGDDDFWFDVTDSLEAKTHAELIASETLRSFVKYTDVAPHNVFGIGILKEGEILTDQEKIILNHYFRLWAEYWGELMDSGYMKDNRGGS